MNGYEYWLPKLANYSIPTIPPSLECTNVSSDDTSDDIRETEIDKTTIKSTSKKTRVHGVVLPFQCLKRSEDCSNNMTYIPAYEHTVLVVGETEEKNFGGTICMTTCSIPHSM